MTVSFEQTIHVYEGNEYLTGFFFLKNQCLYSSFRLFINQRPRDNSWKPKTSSHTPDCLNRHGLRRCFIASCNLHATGMAETTIGYYLQANRTVHINHRTAGSVLLLELGLIWLQHTDLAPAVKEQCDGCYPENQDQ
jgi:hypothetical protein